MLLTKKSHDVPRGAAHGAGSARFVQSLSRGLSNALPTMDRRAFLRRSGLGVGVGLAATQLTLVKKAKAAGAGATGDGKLVVKRTVCTHCSVGCAVDAVVENGIWVRQEPVFDSPINLGERRVPADALVLAVDQLHGVAQAVFTVAMLAQSSPFGAVGTQIDRRVKDCLLADPDAVFNDRVNGTAHGAVGANRALDFNFSIAQPHGTRGCLGLFYQRQLRSGQAHTDAQTGAAQERAAVHCGQRLGQAAAQTVHKR